MANDTSSHPQAAFESPPGFAWPAIGSAEDFLRMRGRLEAEAENGRIALLVGRMHLLAKLLGSTPFPASAHLLIEHLNGYEDYGTTMISSRAQFIIGADVDIPAKLAISLCEAPPEDRWGIMQRYLDGGHTTEEVALVVESFTSDWLSPVQALASGHDSLSASIFSLLTEDEKEKIAWLQNGGHHKATGPTAADVARQWGMPWLAAHIERQAIAEILAPSQIRNARSGAL